MLFAMICLTGRLLAQDFIGLYQHDGAGIAAVLDSPPEYAIQVDVLYQTAAGDTFADVAVVTSEGAFVGLNKVTGLAALKVSLVVTLFDPESGEVIAYGVLAPLDADTPPKPSINFPGDLALDKAPGPGFVWKGAPGSVPGDSQGTWYNKDTDESLWNDMKHGLPIGPHWDYWAPGKKGKWRWFPDGRMEKAE